MRKLMLCFLMAILLVTTVSAFEFDNKKDYYPDERKAVITNAFGFGGTIAEIKLITPYNNYVIPGEDRMVAELEFDNFDKSYNKALNSMEFYNLRKQGREFEREFKYKYHSLNPIEVPNYVLSCTSLFNSTMGENNDVCNSVQDGTRTTYKDKWITFTKVSELPKGKVRVGIFTDVYPGDKVEWIPTLFGKRIPEWAVWSDGLNVDLLSYYRFNETSGAIAFDVGTNDAVSRGTPTWESTDMIIGGAVLVDGNSDMNTTITSLDDNTDFSIAGWINDTSNTFVDHAFFGNRGTDNFFYLAGKSGGSGLLTLIVETGGASSSVDSISKVDNAGWTHVAITYDKDADLWQLYVNGVNEANLSKAAAGTMDEEFWLGSSGVTFHTSETPLLDEFGIWIRELTNAEVTDLYNGGAGITHVAASVALVDIVHPTNITFSNVSELNYTISGATPTDCWYYNGSTNNTVTCGDNVTGLHAPPGSNTWFVYANDTNNNITADSVSFTISVTPPTLNISAPNQTFDSHVKGDRLMLEWLVSDPEGMSKCFWSFDFGADNNSIPCGENDSDMIISIYGQNHSTIYANDSLGNWATANISWHYRIFDPNETTFDDTVLSFSESDFEFNMTYDNLDFNSIVVTLVYNTTRLGTTQTVDAANTSFTASATAPSISTQTIVPFYWEIQATNATGSLFVNSTFKNQTVNPITLDDCGSNSVLLFNYSVRDEETQALLNGSVQNTTVEIDLVLSSIADLSNNLTFSTIKNDTNPVQVCLSDNFTDNDFRIDSQTRYETSGRVSEFYHIQNLTLLNADVPQQINLYDLATADSQEFLITYKDENFLPIEGALIDITRKYIPEGVFKTVEIPQTDSDGNTLGHLVLGDVVYTFIVSKEGQVLATFPNVVAFCDNQATGDCKINLQALAAEIDPEDFVVTSGLTYSMSFNRTSRIITAIFTTRSGASTTVELNGTVFDNYGNDTVCSNRVTSSSGTLTCTVPATVLNSTIHAELFKEGELITQAFYTFKQSASDTFGNTRIILIILLFMTLPLMGLVSGSATIVLGIMGLVIAGLLNLYENGTIIGVGSTMIWLIVAGAILLWKISQRSSL